MIEVVLEKDLIQRLLDLGRRRNEHNISRGLSHRHPGKEGGRSHGVGLIGERGFRWLLDLHKIEYTAAPDWEDDISKWRQDITIGGKTYGVKTAEVQNYPATFKGKSYFFYPAKIAKGESKRVLGYPDHIVACSTNPETGRVWIFAWILGEEAKLVEYRDKNGYPAHHIPWRTLHPIEKIDIFVKKEVPQLKKQPSLFPTPPSPWD